MKLRLQKYMADKGIASRRKSEEYILDGLVKVNGKTIKEMGVQIDPEVDTIEFDGNAIQKDQEEYVYYALNKPLGYVSSAQRTKLEKKIVTELVPKNPRVFPVGRLDKDTTGLLILSNDGRMTYELTHPSKEHEKEYEVKVNPDVSNGALEKLKKGIPILGEKTRPTRIKRLSKNSFQIVLTEGKNRHIRRICRKVGVEVIELKRLRIGQFLLNNIEQGKYKILTQKEVKLLKNI